jgi:uncharacterized membrane protein YsdA (DUF1294 family)
MEEKKQRKWGQVLAKVVWVIFWLGLFTAMFFIPGVDIGITAIVFGCIGYIAGYVSKRHKDNKELAEKFFENGSIDLNGATLSLTTPNTKDPVISVVIGSQEEKKAKEEVPTEKPVKKNKKKKKAEQFA